MLVASLLLFNLGVLRFYRVSSILRSLALMFGAFGLIFSFSRGSWLSVSAGLLVLFAYSIRGTEIRRFKFVGACVAAVMIIGVFVFPLVRERLTQDDNNAAESRIPLMSIAFQMIKAHPVLGIGGNTYHFEMKNYIPKDFEQVYVDQVHNHYLLVFAETGLLGLLCWLVFVKSIVREALSCLKTITSDVTKGVGLGLLLVMVQISVHCMVETFASTMTLATLLSLAAIATAAHRVGLLDKAQDTDVQQVDSPVNAAAEFA
jgi:O-antigen ligase